MKWIVLLATTLLEFSFIYFIPFMHSFTGILLFFIILLFSGFIIQQSREDMPALPKQIINGFMLGTYCAAAIISFLLYKGYLVIQSFM